MPITRETFGTTGGQPVELYTLRNGGGITVRLTTFGARLVGVEVPDRNGARADVVLGFDALPDFVATDHYFGASCGRYGNRIARGRFEIDGKTYTVSCNEGKNHLHGGMKGFDKYVWQAFPVEAENAVVFTHFSPDGDEGFPGDIATNVTYQLNDRNQLVIAMRGTTSKPTILNMVNHAYWNMAGHASGPVHDQMLEIASDFYTPPGEELLITGEVLKVENTPFDFRAAKPIGRDIGRVANAGVAHLSGGGYDHNWIMRDMGPGLRRVAKLWDPRSGRGLSLRSTESGVHVYTGGYISERMVGKGGHPYCPYAGLTFETQKFPGSPNFAHFPPARLDPGEVYEHVMEYTFFA